MGLRVRIIPCLDVDAGRVVKGTQFADLRDAGDPVELAARYDAEGADEIVFYDITASAEQRDTATALARADVAADRAQAAAAVATRPGFIVTEVTPGVLSIAPINGATATTDAGTGVLTLEVPA